MLLELRRIFAGEGPELEINYTIDLSSLEIAPGKYPFKEPVSVRGRVRNKADVVELRAEAVFDFFTHCDRCCREITEHLTVPLNYVLATSAQSEDSDDIIVVENEKLDLDELAVSNIILSLPMKHLCKEDCKGLCPVCGKNLNDGPCGCGGEIDPRLAALKDLFE
ncbi:MAG TPA: DUF177 domain-containing protein [Clostridia bacterium]|nr:DUF177 domain-containing protein [Clostridia bacterium]